MGAEKVMKKFWFLLVLYWKIQDTESVIFFSNIYA